MSEGPGYFLCLGTCFTCGGLVVFNPDLIICPVVDGVGPVTCCEPCMHEINADKVAAGLPPFPINPGAYQPAEGP